MTPERPAPRWLTGAPPPARRAGLRLCLLALLFLLAGCAAPAVEEEASRGGITPRDVAQSFIEDLNQALAADLSDTAVRNRWAEQLASRFAPSERRDQREVMRTMLAGFASSARDPIVGSKVTMEISFERIEWSSTGPDEALVRLVDGAVTLRWLSDSGELLRERTGNLMELLGGGPGLPVLRVDGQWFLTEG